MVLHAFPKPSVANCAVDVPARLWVQSAALVFGPVNVIIAARQDTAAHVGSVREAVMNAGEPSRPELVTNDGLKRWLVALDWNVAVESTVDALRRSRYQRIKGREPEAIV